MHFWSYPVIFQVSWLSLLNRLFPSKLPSYLLCSSFACHTFESTIHLTPSNAYLHFPWFFETLCLDIRSQASSLYLTVLWLSPLAGFSQPKPFTLCLISQFHTAASSHQVHFISIRAYLWSYWYLCLFHSIIGLGCGVETFPSPTSSFYFQDLSYLAPGPTTCVINLFLKTPFKSGESLLENP